MSNSILTNKIFEAFISKYKGTHPFAMHLLSNDEKIPATVSNVSYDADKGVFNVTVDVTKAQAEQIENNGGKVDGGDKAVIYFKDL